MVPRHVLGLVRTSSLRPALSLPQAPSLPRPSRRAVAVAAGLAAAVALAYLAARTTPVFAVREVAVSAPSPAVAAQVRAVVDEHAGASLVAVDGPELEARLRAIPSVRAATVDRAFPHTLAVQVEGERPLAVVRDGERAWVVGASGRVVQEVEPAATPRLARIRVPLSRRLEPGAELTDAPIALALRVLDSLPRGLARDVRVVTIDAGRVDVVLRDRLVVHLGEPTSLAAKVAATAAVLRALPADERAATAYLDATVPERVVVGSDGEP